MAWQGRKYKLEKSENFEEYMKALGVGMVLRKMGNTVNPTIYIEKDGDVYSFHTVSTFKTTVITFKLGEKFDEETLDGRKVKSVIQIDGDTMTQTQEMDKESTIVRTFSDTECKVVCNYGGVTSTRYYKVV